MADLHGGLQGLLLLQERGDGLGEIGVEQLRELFLHVDLHVADLVVELFQQLLAAADVAADDVDPRHLCFERLREDAERAEVIRFQCRGQSRQQIERAASRLRMDVDSRSRRRCSPCRRFPVRCRFRWRSRSMGQHGVVRERDAITDGVEAGYQVSRIEGVDGINYLLHGHRAGQVDFDVGGVAA